MSGDRQSQETVIGAILVLGSLTASFFYGDWTGVAGMGIGLAGGAFGGATLALLIRMLQVSAGNRRPNSFGVALVLAMAGAKIPVLWVLSKGSQALGPAAFDCFLGGVMLVYFGLIAWAGTRPIDGPSASDGHSTS